MRRIEQDILNAMDALERSDGTSGEVLLSIRDRLTIEPCKDGFPVCLYLWYTRIVELYPDHLILRTGGWRTLTTFRRINLLLHKYTTGILYNINGSWMIDAKGMGSIYRDFTYTTERNVVVSRLFQEEISIPRMH